MARHNNFRQLVELQERTRKHQTHKLNWINSLKQKNLKPILEVIDVVPIKEWFFWETYWISQFKSWGFKLVNYTLGGDGCTFANQTSFKKGRESHNNTNTFINCMYCKEKFKISPSRISIRKYCSSRCYNNHKKEKNGNRSGS